MQSLRSRDRAHGSSFLTRLFAVASLITAAAQVVTVAQPANDLFQDRTVLTGTNTTFTADFGNATADAIPWPLPDLASADVWFAWRAPADGHLLIEFLPDAWGTRAIVMLAPLAADGTLSSEHRLISSIEILEVEEGTEYILRVGNTEAMGTSTILLRFTPPPLNDRFENRFSLEGDSIHVEYWAPGAKHDAGEPSLLPNSADRLVWWKWTAPTDGELGVSANHVGVFTNSELSNLVRLQGPITTAAGQEFQIALRGDYSRPETFQLQFVRYLPFSGIEPGGTYPHFPPPVLRWDSIPAGAVITNLSVSIDNSPIFQSTRMVDVTLPILQAGAHFLTATAFDTEGRIYILKTTEFITSHPNATFDTRITITGESPMLEADLRGQNGGWWSWRAPSSGLVAFEDLDGAGFSFAIYTGTNENQLTRVHGNTVQAGITYAITAGHAPGANLIKEGRYLLILVPSDPPNDDFSDSTLISTNSFSQWVCYSCGTLEPEEPESMRGRRSKTIWYSFVPEANGRVLVRAGSGSENWDCAIFTGSELASLQEVNTFQPHVLEAGRTYHLRVQSSAEFGKVGKFIFRFEPQPSDDNLAGAPVLEGDRVQYLTDTTAATSEPGEPNESVHLRSTWRTWIPQSSGFASIRIPALRTPGSGTFPFTSAIPWPGRSVYTGNKVGNLTNVPALPMHDEVTLFWAEAGRPYRIRIAHVENVFLTEPLAVFIDLGQLIISSPTNQAVLTMPDYPRFEFAGPLLTNPATRIELIEQMSYTITSGGIRYNVLDRGIGTYPDFTIHGTNFPPYHHQVFARATTPDGQIAYTLPFQFELRYDNPIPRLTIAEREGWLSIDSWQLLNQKVLLETSVDLTNWTEVITFATNNPPTYRRPNFGTQQFYRSRIAR